MAHTSPLTASRIPDLADAPNGPTAFSNAVLDMEDNTVPRFATASARDSAFSTWVAAGNTMVSGLLCFTQNDLRLWRYDTASSTWKYAGGNPPPIVACTAGAGWATLPSHPPGVYKDSNGLVHLVGGVINNSAYNPQDGLSHTMMQLPSGYFPAAAVTVMVPIPLNAAQFVTASIDTGGLISVTGGSTTNIITALGHVFDGVTFHPTYANSLPLA